MVAREDRRQSRRRHALEGAEDEGPARRVVVKRRLRLRGEAQEAIGVGEQELALRGEHEAPLLPEEEPGTEALLELLHACGDVRLHPVQPRRRLRDPALLGDGLEDLEGGQIDRSHFENVSISSIHFSQYAGARTLDAWPPLAPRIGPRLSASPDPPPSRWRVCTALAVAMGVGRFAFTPILPMMQRETGLTVAHGGWLASANYAGYLLGALAVSILATRVRPATGIRGGLVVITVATLGMGVKAPFAAWIVLRMLAGVASAAVLVYASAWSLDRLARAGRPWLSGVVFAGVGTGIAIAGAFCLLLMAAGAGSIHAWIGLGLLSLAALAAIWRVLGAAADARTSAEGVSTQVAERRDELPDRALRVRFDADTARLIACYGAFGFGYIIPSTFLPAMARQAMPDPLVFGWAWPMFGAAAALSPMLGAVCAARIGSRRVFMLSQLVMAFGVAVPVWWPGIGGMLLAALLIGGTFMVITQTGMQEARTVAGPSATRLMAAMTSAFAAGQVAGPLSVSVLVGPDASLSRPLLAASLALFASALVLALPSPRTRQVH